MKSLFQHSIETITTNQFPSGAFPASPNFPPYKYCWFRDGSYISYALDLVGLSERSELFHKWCANTTLCHSTKISRVINSSDLQKRGADEVFFHCRFTEAGDEVPGQWGNHQLDGLGTWLWSLEKHLGACPKSDMLNEFTESIDLIAEYLIKLWKFPCSDCWEENETDIHFSTLAAVYGGLLAHSRVRGNHNSHIAAQNIKDFVYEQIKPMGYLPKSLHNLEVDASLLWAVIPYELVDLDSPVFKNTLSKIETRLISPGGGVYRYSSDPYYGGGQWILLSAWYGWVKYLAGDKNTADKQLNWIERQAEKGNLPEQVNDQLLNGESYKIWTDLWGQSANPLLWSHAMYIVLKTLIDQS